MLFGGLQKTNLADYPGILACVFFTVGCNFRCPFCHNRQLVVANSTLETFGSKEAFDFLKSRVGKLEGVCITGGEPTLQNDLVPFCAEVKQLGFKIKLDTNGTNETAVKNLIKENLVDYFAIDIKSSWGKYSETTNSKDASTKVRSTLENIYKSKIPIELRTTIVPTIHSKKEVIEMAKDLYTFMLEQKINPKTVKWYLQNFRPVNCFNEKFLSVTPYTKSQMNELLLSVNKYFPSGAIRS